jgi:hypothetical protein
MSIVMIEHHPSDMPVNAFAVLLHQLGEGLFPSGGFAELFKYFLIGKFGKHPAAVECKIASSKFFCSSRGERTESGLRRREKV